MYLARPGGLVYHVPMPRRPSVLEGLGSVRLTQMENVMRRHFGLPTALTAAAIVGMGLVASGTSVRADEVKSGLKPGEAPAAFLVQDATGPAAGTASSATAAVTAGTRSSPSSLTSSMPT